MNHSQIKVNSKIGSNKTSFTISYEIENNVLINFKSEYNEKSGLYANLFKELTKATVKAMCDKALELYQKKKI